MQTAARSTFAGTSLPQRGAQARRTQVDRQITAMAVKKVRLPRWQARGRAGPGQASLRKSVPAPCP